MAKGKTRACGVANWELEWLQELKDANVTLPAVVQVKFHLHQSFASPRIKALDTFIQKLLAQTKTLLMGWLLALIG